MLLNRFGRGVNVIGGGTMLVPLMTRGTADARHVLALQHLGLDTISLQGERICIGALATYACVLGSRIVSSGAPLLRAMAKTVTGGPSILQHGTLGGSACFANPASDVPACLVALDAELELVSVSGVRRVNARRFFKGAFQTERRIDEFLARIWIPKISETQSVRYDKHKSCTSSWPIVTVACVLHRGPQPALTLSVGAAAHVPTWHHFTPPPDPQAPEDWIACAAEQVTAAVAEGYSDELADANYRRAIVPGVVRRMLRSVLKEVPA